MIYFLSSENIKSYLFLVMPVSKLKRQSVVYLSIGRYISYNPRCPLSFYNKIPPFLWQQKSNQKSLHQFQHVQNVPNPVQGSWGYKLLPKPHLTQMGSFILRRRPCLLWMLLIRAFKFLNSLFDRCFLPCTLLC